MSTRYVTSGLRMHQPIRNGRKKGFNFKQTSPRRGRSFAETPSPAQFTWCTLSQTKSSNLKGDGLRCGLYLTSRRCRFCSKFGGALTHLRSMLRGEDFSGRRSWILHVLARGVFSLYGNIFSNRVIPVASCDAILNACWSQGSLYPISVAKLNDMRSRQQADCD
jgi:hypothetical protein